MFVEKPAILKVFSNGKDFSQYLSNVDPIHTFSTRYSLGYTNINLRLEVLDKESIVTKLMV